MRDDERERLTIVIMKDRDSKIVFSDIVEAKGQGTSGTIQRIVDNISRLGYKQVIIKSDQEPALIDLINGIIEFRDDPTIPRHSPVGESQSNGLVERAVRSSKDQIRTSKLALQKRIESKITPGHPSMAWLVQHAGETISKFQIGKDNMTAYERLMGEPCKEQVVEFGERVYYKPGLAEDLEPRWSTGVWLGKRWASGEHYIHIGPEVIKCRAVHRLPLEERWRKSDIESIVALPWKLRPSPQDSADNARVLPRLPQHGTGIEPPQARQPDVGAPLRPRITKSDLSRWGFTDGCLRCRQMRNGQAEDGSKHNEKCRRRIENEMRREGDPRVKQAEDKHTAFQEEMLKAKEAIDRRTRNAARSRRGGDEHNEPNEKPENQDTGLHADSANRQESKKASPSSGSNASHPAAGTNIVDKEELNIVDKDKLNIVKVKKIKGTQKTGDKDEQEIGDTQRIEDAKKLRTVKFKEQLENEKEKEQLGLEEKKRRSLT